ncbi:MAG: hypothetical protein C5B50_29975 [Verrucomicrobia bacterium]|nr:MAG: hypothetical protein C5B50_29975 [Verrucomicrobiota bacterium]
MTLLPLVRRELCVRSRGSAAHWARFSVALAGMLLYVCISFAPGPFGITVEQIGHGIFTGLISAAFLLCCSACLLSADSIAAERREGTLGLLLLTPVRHFEIVVGKIASTGLASFFALVTLLPLLMIPLLAGGVTGGEVFRKELVLTDTLFLALAAGLWASARSREKAKAATSSLGVFSVLLLGPLVFSLLPEPLASTVRSLSPLVALSRASDLAYRSEPGWFWLSLLLVWTAGWFLLLGANAAMRRLGSLDPEETRSPVIGLPSALTFHTPLINTGLQPGGDVRRGPKAVLKASPNPEKPLKRLLPAGIGHTGLKPGVNETSSESPPIIRRLPSRITSYWLRQPILHPISHLLQRQQGTRRIIWAAALLSFFHRLLFGFVSPFLMGFGGGAFYFGFFNILSWSLGLAASAITGALFAWAFSRFFIESRRTGELEILLTTPVGAREIVSAQWAHLKRLLIAPLLLILAPICLHSFFTVTMLFSSPRYAFGSEQKHYYELLSHVVSILLSLMSSVLALAALCWLALWFGLRFRTQSRAIICSVALGVVLPQFVSFTAAVFLRPVWSVLTFYWAVRWFITPLPSIVVYLLLIRWAKTRLSRELVA